MVKTAEINFTQLANVTNLGRQGHTSGLLCSPSSCGRYFVAARASRIYIYALQVGTIAPIGHIACPRNVITIEIDVWDGKIAVAALLEAKLGVMYEFDLRLHGSIDSGDTDQTDGSVYQQNLKNLDSTRNRKTDPIAAIYVRSDNHHMNLERTDKHQTYEKSLINQT